MTLSRSGYHNVILGIMENKKFNSAIKANNRTKRFVSKSIGIGDEILAALKRKGMTQRELAEKLGCTETLVSRWLGGLQNFTLRTLTHIEEALEQDLILTPLKAAERFKEKTETSAHEVMISSILHDQLSYRVRDEHPSREIFGFTHEMYLVNPGMSSAAKKHHLHNNVVAKKSKWQPAD